MYYLIFMHILVFCISKTCKYKTLFNHRKVGLASMDLFFNCIFIAHLPIVIDKDFFFLKINCKLFLSGYETIIKVF